MTHQRNIIEVVKEEWRPVKDWNAYEVSNYGRVRSMHRAGRIRNPHVKNGYHYIDLWQDGDCLDVAIHRLVLYAFGPPATPDMECNHIDGNKSNNRIDNLEWVTRSYNQVHAIRMGLANPVKLSPYKKGHTPWNKCADRTCIVCKKPDSIKARRMCGMCWQRWRFNRTGLSKKDLQKALLTKDEQLKIAREALEQVRYYIDFAPTKEEGAKEAYREAVKALELISSLTPL